MDTHHETYTSPLTTVFVVLFVFSSIFILYGIYKYRTETTRLNQNLLHVQTELASSTRTMEAIQASLVNSQSINDTLSAQLSEQIDTNNSFATQIQSISSTVGQLDKLSKTDKELLQKYSDVYFLNENYVPSSLSLIDTEFLFRANKAEQIHTSVKPYLQNLLQSAAANGVHFSVLSGYRSFGTQATLKASYRKTYGAGTANVFSADQGYSEHQLGSTVDFTATSTGEKLTGFEKTPGYTWLVSNAYKFGFIISYPKSNTFFVYEPWHWRFVGVELATTLHTQNKYFYDMSQRDIDTYLVKIFD